MFFLFCFCVKSGVYAMTSIIHWALAFGGGEVAVGVPRGRRSVRWAWLAISQWRRTSHAPNRRRGGRAHARAATAHGPSALGRGPDPTRPFQSGRLRARRSRGGAVTWRRRSSWSGRIRFGFNAVNTGPRRPNGGHHHALHVSSQERGKATAAADSHGYTSFHPRVRLHCKLL